MFSIGLHLVDGLSPYFITHQKGFDDMQQTAAKNYNRTTALVLCGVFAAIMAVCSFITIPLGFTPIPINLATLGVFLTGGLLGKKYGSISIMVYILLGGVGVPIFAGFKGGLGVLAGPTGGYIIGYLAAVFLTGLLVEFTFAKTSAGIGANKNGSVTKYRTLRFIGIILAMIVGLAACYALGTAWFMISTGTGLGAAMISCVIPFLPGDAIKIIAAALLTQKLKGLIPTA